MKYVVWGLVALLVVLHQDNWNWNDGTLVWGWMPETLLYHAGISFAAAFTWFLATLFAWPVDEELAAAVAAAPPSDPAAPPTAAIPTTPPTGEGVTP